MNPDAVTYFAQTDARNKKIPFGIKSKDRTKHVYVIGKTGMGKSTLLENMAVQDIKNGEGMAFIDPHGKTADLLLEYVPAERIKDVIYFAPFDTEHPISFNVMEDVGPSKRHLVANGLMSSFKKIWVDMWSARMEYILNNILLALLEYPDSTIIGVNRMLSDKDYRKKVVANVSDPSVKSFWVDEFEKYGERYMQEAGAAIQNKIGQFVSNPLVRNIVGQTKSTFDIRKVMDDRKILIINLSKGLVGEANANLLGSMLITKIYLGAMSRADVSEKVLQSLPQFYLYVDEFQSFANESFADILSEARKYKLNLTVAHQYIEQMSEEVRDAVFGNVGTMIVFRVGAFDAEVLEKEFMPTFTAEDLVNLGFVQIYLKLMIDGVASPPFSATSLPPIAKQETTYRKEILENSRLMFTHPKEEVEAEIKAWHQPINSRQVASSAPTFGSKNFAGDNRQQAVVPNQFAQPKRTDSAPHTTTPHTTAQPKKTPQAEPMKSASDLKPRKNDMPKMPPQSNPFETIKVAGDGKIETKPQSISLQSLKPKENSRTPDAKVPSKENLFSLKQALASIVDKSKNEKLVPERVVNPLKTETVKESAKETQKAEAKENLKEVPEDVLRKILGA